VRNLLIRIRFLPAIGTLLDHAGLASKLLWWNETNTVPPPMDVAPRKPKG
jgi:hypothetical protein